LQRILLKNRKIVITGGPTREKIDPVRFISNYSTGKMGVAIADEAFKRAQEIVLIHGPVQKYIVSDKKYKSVSIETTGELLDAVLGELVDNAVLIMAAAPADYTPIKKSLEKIKKSKKEMALKLKRTPDILQNVSELKKSGSYKGLFLVGFAAETDNAEANALSKLRDKKLDMICLNDLSKQGAGFGSDTNIVTIYSRNGEKKELQIMPKRDIAENLLDFIEEQL